MLARRLTYSCRSADRIHGEHRLRQVGRDGWTAVTADGSSAAQFEHTVVLRSTGHPDRSRRCEILTKRNPRSRLTVATDRMVEVVDCVASWRATGRWKSKRQRLQWQVVGFRSGIGLWLVGVPFASRCPVVGSIRLGPFSSRQLPSWSTACRPAWSGAERHGMAPAVRCGQHDTGRVVVPRRWE